MAWTGSPNNVKREVLIDVNLLLAVVVGLVLYACGAAGAVIIGSWLAEAKQIVIENMAPVLTRSDDGRNSGARGRIL